MRIPPRPHLLARSALVDRLNDWLEQAWRIGLATRPTLDPDALWAKALRGAPAAGEAGGRTPDDVADFRYRLERLGEALCQEAELNPLGRTMAHAQLLRAIRQRLQFGALWQRRPELLEQPIVPPIIVVGQMRSGTTRVHRLLAADPDLAATRFCDSWLPMPRRPDTRPLWSALSLVIGRRINPWLDAIHPFGPTRPDEELGWLACALDHCAYEAQWRIPGFVAFSEARDPAPVYHEFMRILRTDAAWHGNGRRPRVLKVPQFAEDLRALLAQFPGARVIRTRRRDDDTARSAVSLVANQMTIQSDAADLRWIEDEVARKIALRETRMDAALTDFGGRLAEVEFSAMERDWEAEIGHVYEGLDMRLSDRALSCMRDEQRRSARTVGIGRPNGYRKTSKGLGRSVRQPGG